MLFIFLFYLVVISAARTVLIKPRYGDQPTVHKKEPVIEREFEGNVHYAAVQQGLDHAAWSQNLEESIRQAQLAQENKWSQRTRDLAVDPIDADSPSVGVRAGIGSSCLADIPLPNDFNGKYIDMQCAPRGAPCGYGTFIYPSEVSKQFNRQCNYSANPGVDGATITCRFCPAGQVCSDNVCKDTFGAMEEPCNNDAQCEPFAESLQQPTPRCISGYCSHSSAGLGINGDYCSTVADCIAGMQCISDMPGAPARCRNAGGCASHTECSSDRYCSGGNCVPRLDEGASSFQSHRCKIGLVSSNGKCRKMFSLLNEQDCEDSSAKLFGCAIGLQCVNDGGWICRSDNANTVHQECFLPEEEVTQDNGDYEYTTYDNVGCELGYTCDCELNNFNGDAHCRPVLPPTQYYALQWERLAACAAEHDCRLEQESAFTKTCIANHCQEEFSCLQRAYESGMRPDRLILPGCSASDAVHMALCVDPENDAASLLPSLWS